MTIAKGPAEAIWDQLRAGREPYLERARDAASVTVPYLMPEEGSTDSTDFPTPYQGLGARGVNNLASKLLITLFPPGEPFFRLRLDPAAVEELTRDGRLSEDEKDKVAAEVDATLARTERMVLSDLETRSARPALFEAFRHLIVAGTVLLLWPPGDDPITLFRLDEFVLQRDRTGRIIRLAAKQQVSERSLPQDFVRRLKESGQEPGHDPSQMSAPKTYTVYTGAELIPGEDAYRIWQEAGGLVVPRSARRVSTDRFPFIAPRFNQVAGESYGRGLVEEYLGDLTSLEALTRSIVQGSMAAAFLLWMVNPSGMTRPQVLKRARFGDYVSGRDEDVKPLQLAKQLDFTVAATTAGNIARQLEHAFLLATAVRRDAERVTAEEIRQMVTELESALGGVYSLLTQELQLPIVRLSLIRLQANGTLPKLPQGLVQPQVLTGVEGLGRGQDFARLQALAAGAQAAIGPEAFASAVNLVELLHRFAAAAGVNAEGLIKTEEELAAERQQALQMQLASDVGPSAIGALQKTIQNRQEPTP